VITHRTSNPNEPHPNAFGEFVNPIVSPPLAADEGLPTRVRHWTGSRTELLEPPGIVITTGWLPDWMPAGTSTLT